MWTHNATWGISGAGQSQLPWLPAVGGVIGAIALVTVVLNVFLLLSILLHEPSRSRSFHLHIVSMAVAALLQGAGVLPLWTHYLMRGSWIHGDSLCRWWLAADCMAFSVTALALVITACDRFIYLICWRFIREGGKYVISFCLLFLSWLLALSLTLTLTLLQIESDGGSRSGVQSEGQCTWGLGRGTRMVATRLITYAVGAGLGAGLSLALLTLPCLGMGHVLPIDEDEGEMTRRKSLLSAQRGSVSRPEGGEVDEDEDFPMFLFIDKTDRLEERERWKWQVISLLAVSVVWVLMWLPSHLFTFAQILGLQWDIPVEGMIASVLLGYLQAALMPLLWLLHQPIRVAIKALIFCRCCRKEEDDGDSMEFQDVAPYRPSEVMS